MKHPALISVFSDQRRTKSTTWSRVSGGTHTPVRVPQDFFLAQCAPPSARPAPHPCAGSSSPATRCGPAPAGDSAGSSAGMPRPHSRRSPFASGRTSSGAVRAFRTGPKSELSPANAPSKWRPSPLRCGAFVLFSRVSPFILTEERFLHFQLRRDTDRKGSVFEVLHLGCTAREFGTATICLCCVCENYYS